jgi:hypothetical protein
MILSEYTSSLQMHRKNLRGRRDTQRRSDRPVNRRLSASNENTRRWTSSDEIMISRWKNFAWKQVI